MTRTMVCLALLLVAWNPTSLFAQQADAERDRARGYYYVGLNIDNTDVGELVAWIEYFGLALPFAIEGEVNAQLTAGVPLYEHHDTRA